MFELVMFYFYKYTYIFTQYITQIAYILIRWIHAFTVHTFYNVYTALLPYSYFVYFINITSFYVPKYNAKFKTTLWNKSTKHKKRTWLPLGLNISYKQTVK